jgi:hypothetical protein
MKRTMEQFELRLEQRRSAYGFPPAAFRLSTRRLPRRGVLLLVVLSTLVLFLLVGTAFVITAKQTEQAAKASSRAANKFSTETAQADLLDEVVRQMVRDTDNAHSALRFHSLLADMYGNDGWTATIESVQWANPTVQYRLEQSPSNGGRLSGVEINPGGVTAGQLVRFAISPGTQQDLYGNDADANDGPNDLPFLLSAIEDAYAGQTVTILGPGEQASARGATVRIMGYSPPTSAMPAYLTVLAFPLANGESLASIDNGTNGQGRTKLDALDGSRILVTGRPFNGTGAGLDPNVYTNGQAIVPRLIAGEQISGVSWSYQLPSTVWPNGTYVTAPPLALLPNATTFDPAKVIEADPPQLGAPSPPPAVPYFPLSPLGIFDRNGRGGADESYDAPDFQNMALAMIPGVDGNDPSASRTTSYLVDTVLPDLTGSASGLSRPSPSDNTKTEVMVLPSFHRPDLVNYWWGQSGALATNSSLNPLLLRRILMRPSPLDHPNFTGSNPEFAQVLAAYHQSGRPAAADRDNLLKRLVFGPWDVDNDNDGVRDSVWVDFGAPVMAGPDGKLVKPLAAILCVDLDGRLNVNAAGSLDLAEVIPDVRTRGVLAGGTVEADDTPRGLGLGPAEIDLRPVTGPMDFQRLLVGDTTLNPPLPGRYGSDRIPGRSGADLMSQVGFNGWPRKSNQLSSFATPPDLRARYGLGINAQGQPIFEATLVGEPDTIYNNSDFDLLVNTPYDLDLSATSARGTSPTVGGVAGSPNPADMPYTLDEFERTQRIYDSDASSLPRRLVELAGIQKMASNDGDVFARLNITTDSYDLPIPSVSMPAELEPLLTTTPLRRTPKSFSEILEMRVRQSLFPVKILANGNPDPNDPNRVKQFPLPLSTADAASLNAAMRMILAPELARGEKMNLNRPLGNGRDDDGNFVVDEPAHAVCNDANGNKIADQGEIDWRPTAAVIGTERGQQVWNPATGDQAVASQFSSGAAGAVGAQLASANFPDMAQEVLPDGTVVMVDHRQLLARHLYVLALTLTARPGYDPLNKQNAQDNGATSDVDESKLPQYDRDLARRLAQWAINVVDFRDADNIMTPFEYDLDPFDGWYVDHDLDASTPPIRIDGDLRTVEDHWGIDKASFMEDNPATTKLDETRSTVDDTYVWGAEKPELVMTETLAWHDRRTDDSTSESPYPATDDSTGRLMNLGRGDANRKRDLDFDQVIRPWGASFIELYNPSEPSPMAAGDTHDRLTRPGYDMGVNLAAVAVDPNDPTRRSPVWRITAYKRGAVDPADVALWNPDFPAKIPLYDEIVRQIPNSPYRTTRPSVHADRSIYMAGFDPEVEAAQRGEFWDDDGVAYFNETLANRGTRDNLVPAVRPGRYLVIGSGERDQTNLGPDVYATPIGGLKQTPDAASRNSLRVRRIELDLQNVDHKLRMVDESTKTTQFVVAPAERTANLMEVPGEPGRLCITDVAIIDQVTDVEDNFDDAPGGSYGVSSAIPGDVRKFSSSPRRRRFSLSEPALGYVTQFNGSRWSDDSRQYVDSGNRTNMRAVDVPLDGPIGGQTQLEFNLNGADPPEYLDRDFVPTAYRSRLNVLGKWPYSTATTPTRRYADVFLNPIEVDPVLTNLVPNGPNQGATYSVLFLQRLANPLLPWNPEAGRPGHDPKRPVNPYLTVDSNTANLTVFNSRGDANDRGHEENPTDPDNTKGTNTNLALTRLRSHERGFTFFDTASKYPSLASNIWSYEMPSTDQAVNAQTGLVLKQAPPNGNPPLQNELVSMTRVPIHSLGFLNASMGTPPQTPLPWFTWNNRPYVGGNELALVPTWGPSELVKSFSLDPSAASAAADRVAPVEKIPYPELGVQPGLQIGDPTKKLRPFAPFTHLGNFYYTGPSLIRANAYYKPPNAAGNQRPLTYSVPSKLYRVLDYLGTQSLFAGTQTWMNPQVFRTAAMTPTASDPRFHWQAPYNAVSAMREPGKVNLNTIGSRAVWDGLFHGNYKHRDGNGAADPLLVQPLGDPKAGREHSMVHSGPPWNLFVSSRRGYIDFSTLGYDIYREDRPGLDLFRLDPNLPTFFGNPFRSAESADLVPLDPMVQRHTIYDTTAATPRPLTTWLAGAECTLVRSNDEAPASLPSQFQTTLRAADISGAHPLFAAQSPFNQKSIPPNATPRFYAEPTRNPFFAYAPLARMASLTTTRSNCYQIWVTIGFFEVTPVPAWNALNSAPRPFPKQADFNNDPNLYNQVYPDGYALGSEAGSDTGEIRRLRGYYILDRTIPVGFEPGVDHNSDNVVRLRRRIE